MPFRHSGLNPIDEILTLFFYIPIIITIHIPRLEVKAAIICLFKNGRDNMQKMIMVIGCVLIGLLSGCTTTVRQIGPIGVDALRQNARSLAQEWEGHYYWFSEQKLSWLDAKRYAEEAGGYLVIIDSAEENEFVKAHMREPWSWIGVHSTNFESAPWITVKGGSLYYENWDVGEGWDPRQQPFVGLLINGKMHDFNGANEYYRFIVEWDSL